MAGKKKESTTVPQKWEDVPEIPKGEQPYPMPEGWKWVKFGDMNLYKNKSINPFHEKEKTFELYSVPSSANNYPEIIKGKDIGSVKQEVNLNDVLLCKINPRINRVWKVSGYTSNKLLASSEWIVFRNNKISADYVKWFFASPIFRKFMLLNVSGVGGSLMRAQPKFVATYPIPIPPIETQRRIVTRIESLFSKLDEAAEKVQAVIDSHKSRKQAILHKAFSGELTQDVEIIEDENYKNITEIPKEEQPYPLPQGWKWVKLKDLYLLNPKVKADDTVTASFVPMAKISSGMTGKFTYEIKPWGKIKKSFTQFEDGDVAFAKISPCFENGKRMLVQNLKNGIGAGTTELIILRNKNVSQKFSLYLISTDRFIKNGIKTYSGTVGQQRINMDYVRNYPIPLPPIQTQQRIIARIESLFSQLDEVIETSEKILDKIKNMKNSILILSFQGKLC